MVTRLVTKAGRARHLRLSRCETARKAAGASTSRQFLADNTAGLYTAGEAELIQI